MSAPIGQDADSNVVLNYVFGHVVLESRMRPEGNRIIGEGRAWHYDGDGKLTKDTGWEPTGVVLIWPDQEPCKWWKFW